MLQTHAHTHKAQQTQVNKPKTNKKQKKTKKNKQTMLIKEIEQKCKPRNNL